MTVLTRLFRQAAPADKTLDEQIAELPAQSAEFNAGIALSAGEPALRIAAIERLSIGESLFKLADDAAEGGDIQRAAQQRIAHLIDSNEYAFAEYGRRTTNMATLLSVAAYCNDVGCLQSAIASITDPEQLTRLAIEGASSKVRQLAAEAIHDPAQLRQVLKDVRGKDKNVYKIIKQKCDALHAEEKAAAETQTHIVALCAALERHVHHPLDNLFTPTLEHLNSQWNVLVALAPADIKLRAEQAIDRCRAAITQHVQALASQAARAGAIANADASRQSIVGELRKLLTAVYDSEPIEDVTRQVAQCEQRWKEIAGYKSPTAGDQAAFAQLGKAISDLNGLIAQHGTLQVQADRFRDAAADADVATHVQVLKNMLSGAALLDGELPIAVVEATAALQAWEQSRHDKQAAEANALRQLTGLIRKASGVLADGKTGAAAGLRRAIEERLHALPIVPAHLSSQLQTLDEKLNLLQDWRSYAVAPKRIELIEQMEGLIGSTESPQVLADNIKRLQEEWKLISKGNTEDTDAEWQRFHQAAQTAYQPCREHFAAQAKVRADNLQRRKTLLGRLSGFVAAQNWEQVDWREVARALRESKQQWRNHQPVERAANKPLQESFDALTDDLQARLEAESAKNAAEKKSLIARAQRLLDSSDSRQATEEVKRLQLAWKNVGIVARDDDQKLWAEFREHCDALFAKRQQQSSEQSAALQESKSRAIALCEEAEQVLTLSGSDLFEGVKKLSALRELFDAIGELPKANARDLQNRFDRALERCEKSVAQQRARDKAQAWDNVLGAAGKIRDYRFAVSANATAEACDALRQAAQAFIDAVAVWPKGALQVVKSELAKTDAADIAANETKLRTLCVRAEILTDTPTPESDQTFRRNYQLQRLMQGMGQARGSTKEELDAMVMEWIGVSVTRPEVYTELLARFKHCRDQHQKHQ